MPTDWLTLQRRLPWLVTATYAVCILTLGLYIVPGQWGSSKVDHYEQYAKHLWEGRLWVKNAEHFSECPVDASFYKGRCYLYWGIVPAFFRLLPFGSDRRFALIGSIAAIFFLVLCLMEIARVLSKEDTADPLVLLPIALFLAFGSGLGTTALWGSVYGEAINVSHAFGMAGIWLSLSFARNETAAKAWGACGLLALAALTRATWFSVLAPVMTYQLFLSLRKREKI